LKEIRANFCNMIVTKRDKRVRVHLYLLNFKREIRKYRILIMVYVRFVVNIVVNIVCKILLLYINNKIYYPNSLKIFRKHG